MRRDKKFYVRGFRPPNQGGGMAFEVWCDSDGALEAEIGACLTRIWRGELSHAEIDDTEKGTTRTLYEYRP